jgi:hypothetical protein
LAARLLTPTAVLTQTSFLRDSNPDYGDSPTLTYSIGCHSGLSVVDNDITPGAAASKYSADFPSAFVKQNGNWIGNTGFGYGDSDLVGYSEQLALLFTKAIGRKVLDGNGHRPNHRRLLTRPSASISRTAGRARSVSTTR